MANFDYKICATKLQFFPKFLKKHNFIAQLLQSKFADHFMLFLHSASYTGRAWHEQEGEKEEDGDICEGISLFNQILSKI